MPASSRLSPRFNRRPHLKHPRTSVPRATSAACASSNPSSLNQPTSSPWPSHRSSTLHRRTHARDLRSEPDTRPRCRPWQAAILCVSNSNATSPTPCPPPRRPIPTCSSRLSYSIPPPLSSPTRSRHSRASPPLRNNAHRYYAVHFTWLYPECSRPRPWQRPLLDRTLGAGHANALLRVEHSGYNPLRFMDSSTEPLRGYAGACSSGAISPRSTCV